MNHPYKDILYLPNPTSKKHPRMSMYDRAAQFSPFAALTGYDAQIQETARLTNTKIELSDDEKKGKSIIMRLKLLFEINENLSTA